MLDYCARHGHPHLIYISSSSVFYRAAYRFDLTEESPIPPDAEQINAYSRTKRQLAGRHRSAVALATSRARAKWLSGVCPWSAAAALLPRSIKRRNMGVMT